MLRRLPSWFWLVLAAVFATAATLAWFKSQPRQQEQTAVRQSKVVVAKKDIGPAIRLMADQLQVANWHQESLPPGSFSRIEELDGRVTSQPIMEGELILDKRLAPRGTVPGLTALLPPNKRAMTVKVDEASGVAGFISPDNRVDVLVTLDKGDYNKDPVSKMVFQNLRVLGTGQRIESRTGDKPQVVPTVTLEVTPEEGERLALAAQEGRISLVLRGQEDEKVVPTPGVNAAQLLGKLVETKADPGQQTPPARSQHAVEVIRGLQRESASF